MDILTVVVAQQWCILSFSHKPLWICWSGQGGRRQIGADKRRKVTDGPQTMIRSEKLSPRIVAHADMDAFYAAIQQLDDAS